ncbi:MAG: glucosyltransferase domain-containing protein [Lachnospiraceae bacterium]|nr:glucosyltransferase domain-containing protein [Lachnospiraceae bacterium]
MLTRIFSDEQKRSGLLASLFGGAVYILTNGYRFFQTSFAGDALLMVYQNDAAWQIALGRFMQPFLILVRGSIAAPFLISVLALCWLMGSIFLVTDLLKIKSKAALIMTGAVMASGPTFICANASYLPWVDLYCLSLFLSVLGAWLFCKKKYIPTLFGALAIAVSVGIYQSYVCVAIGLLMIRFILDTLDGVKLKDRFLNGLKWLSGFAIGAAVYLAVWKYLQHARNIWTANTYNGLANIGDYSGLSLFEVIAITYGNVLESITKPLTYVTISFSGRNLSVYIGTILAVLGIIGVILTLVILVIANIKRKTGVWDLILQCVLILLYPFGINVVCFLARGMEHPLMSYALVLVPVFEIICTDLAFSDTKDLPDKKKVTALIPRIGGIVIMISLTLSVWSSCVYGNQTSLKVTLQEKSVDSLMTRIISRIETTEGYIPGVTQVAFSGNFESNPHLTELTDFTGIDIYGVRKTTLSYPGTDYAYLKYFEQTDLNLTRVPDDDERLKNKPCYPEQGSLFFIDDVLIVKISD